MKNWFLLKVSYNKETLEGGIRKVNEEYLFNADTYGESEALIYEKLKGEVDFGFCIKSVSKIKIDDFFYTQDRDDFLVFAKAKYNYSDFDDITGKEKKKIGVCLFNFKEMKDAPDLLSSHISKSGIQNFKINAISSTKIKNVFI